MEIDRWHPSTTLSNREERVMKRLKRTRKLFGFLRLHRHELFDDTFQAELESMYRGSGAGKPPVPPALLAMALLLQGYTHLSDAETVEQTAFDARWQMVLDHLGSEEPAFSQGALCEFRNRLIRHNMDLRLLERTVELARQTKIFDWRKLPKTLRVAMDSSPLEGAGRVEDTLNLLAHAARKALTCAARLLERSPEQVATLAGAPMLVASSIKRALDLEWSDPEQKASALSTPKRFASYAAKTWSPILPTAVRAFDTALPKIAASPSRTRRCGTVERAKANDSTASRDMSQPISTPI